MQETIISSLAWVRKGYAQSKPKEYEMLEEEVNQLKQEPEILDSMKQAQKIQREADRQKKKNNKKNNKNGDDDEEEDGWDEEEFQEGDEEEDHVPTFTSEFAAMKKGIPQFSDGYKFAYDEISNEDKEDYLIRPSDSLLVAAKIEKEFSSLEVYVYEQDKSSLFVHHEITLSAFPLALEWLPLNPTSFEGEKAQAGNFVIVGTFLPEIEIWDLDVINAIEPSVILGGELDEQEQMQIQQKQKKTKKVKKFNQQNSQQLFREGSHTSSVLSLNINSFRQNILISGSADQTVKLWDLSVQKNMHTFKTHTGKVQVVSWNPFQEAVLMSGGYDKNIVLQDVRQPQNALVTTLNSEVESGGWCPQDENILYASTEDGYVSILDARKIQNNSNKKSKNTEDQYIAHFKAHNKQTTSVSFNSQIPGMLSTTSMDKTVKIFDLQTMTDKAPKLVSQKNPNTGGLFCGSFYKDSAFVFACGNSKGEVFVWDTAEDKKIVEQFGNRVATDIQPKVSDCTQGASVKTHNRVISDDEDSDDEDDHLYANNNNEQGIEQE